MANKYLDNDGVLYLWNKIKSYVATAISGKVDSEAGKGLSTNDYTTAEKNKLSGIESGAEANVIESVKVNGSALTVTGKAVDVEVPTKTSDLTNDSNFAVDSSYVHTDNNYTTADKNKLAGVASGAQANVIETVKVNGTAQTVTGKAVDIAVPTATSDLTNDSGFITLSQVPEGAVASTTTPSMDGTASAGTETAFARGDHVHPHDSTKVDKVSGKGLSTNDYTTAEKEKLAGIEAGAQVNPTNVSAFTNDAGYLTQHQDISGKVDKVSGKGLSTNDYTTAEKNKLAGIESGAEENVIETISVNGSEQTVTNKTVDIEVPTKVSDLTNDSGFLTSYTETDPTVPAWAKAANKPTYTAAEVGALPDTTAIPSASTATPLMDGTAAVGTSSAFARGDHRHPSDSNKVDKVSGKGLSTNDYTTAEKNKLAGIEAGAQVNVVTDVSKDTDGDFNYVVIEKGEGSYTALEYSSFLFALQNMVSALENKVDAESGKGLSTNDYTDAEKNKLAAFGAASTYALKSDITNMYKYKGSVAAVANLPSSGNTTGDVYNVEASGMNYAWNGTAWDALGEIFTITAITNSEIDTITAS